MGHKETSMLMKIHVEMVEKIHLYGKKANFDQF